MFEPALVAVALLPLGAGRGLLRPHRAELRGPRGRALRGLAGACGRARGPAWAHGGWKRRDGGGRKEIGRKNVETFEDAFCL